MGIVWVCRLDVEAYLAAGRNVAVPRLRCPACRGRLIFWSGYERFLRRRGASVIMWVRRGKCRPCGVSHALSPAFLLRRRLDSAAVIGTALARMVGGIGARTVAGALDVPHSTARDWRRRHRSRAPAWLARAEALVVELGGELPRWPQDVERAALEGLLAAWRRAVTWAAGGQSVGLWQFVSAVTGASWLSTTTTAPWAGATGRPLITATSSSAP